MKTWQTGPGLVILMTSGQETHLAQYSGLGSGHCPEILKVILKRPEIYSMS